jgi:ribonuclease HII
MICGIDEAGRGCLAGPLVVAGVILKKSVLGLADSKKLSQKRREVLFEQVIENAHYEIVFTDNKMIDKIGLSKAIKNSIVQIMSKLKAKQTIMDGNTTFGVDGVEAIIKADDKIAEVSAASILAKVSRDRYIVKQALNYPEYGFEKHKGYGTKLHRKLIQEHGYCDLHRLSFKIKDVNIK